MIFQDQSCQKVKRLMISLLSVSSYHWAFPFPLECTSDTWFSMVNELLFLIFLGESLLEFPLKERFFLILFLFIITMVCLGGTLTALSTQSPAWAHPHCLVDVPSSQSGLSLRPILCGLLECSPSCLMHTGQGGSLLLVFGVDWSRHSAWKTCWHGSTPVTGMSLFLMMDRDPQGDFCEMYLSHNPHLNVLEATTRCASRSGSGTSVESTLLGVPLLQLQASAESEVVSLALSEGWSIGWTGLDRKNRLGVWSARSKTSRKKINKLC